MPIILDSFSEISFMCVEKLSLLSMFSPRNLPESRMETVESLIVRGKVQSEVKVYTILKDITKNSLSVISIQPMTKGSFYSTLE